MSVLVFTLLVWSGAVLAGFLGVNVNTVRSWEQGLRQPSPIARRFLDEIEMSPSHFRGRLLAATVDTQRPGRIGGSAAQTKRERRRS